MLKEILIFALYVVVLGMIFWFILNLPQKRIWRIINAFWVYGFTILMLFIPVVNAFRLSATGGFKVFIFASILFIGVLTVSKSIDLFGEKAVTALENLVNKLEHKLKGKG